MQFTDCHIALNAMFYLLNIIIIKQDKNTVEILSSVMYFAIFPNTL